VCQSYLQELAISCYKDNKWVKTPYLEKLIFRNLQADLIPVLGLICLFPKLNDVNVLPRLQVFHLHYTKPSNEQNGIKSIVKWLGEDLTKNRIMYPQYDTKSQKQKSVPRDLKEAISCALLQSKFGAKSLILPRILAWMVRFCQKSGERCMDDEGELVFDIGWLVDNNTE
jgi:hypothetical protein